MPYLPALLKARGYQTAAFVAALVLDPSEGSLFVRAPRGELYDLVADPGALHNLADSRPRVADGLDAELARFLRGPTGTDSKSSVDPALAKRLASLGYVSGSGSGQSTAATDPKDRISVANALQAAVSAVEDGAFHKAIPLLERVAAEEPTIQMAQLQLGVARARQRQYAQAIGPLRKAIALQPNSDARALRARDGLVRDRRPENVGRAFRDRHLAHAEVGGRTVFAGLCIRAD